MYNGIKGGISVAFLNVFMRYELKYILTRAQKETVLSAIEPYMKPDSYGCSTIRNIYFDTDNYRLIRRSIEKPVYKEKLRVRSYSRVDADSIVFAELKKKYRSVVYKRRISLPEKNAMDWLCGGDFYGEPTQISREIDYFKDFYGTLAPRVFLSYEREAFYSRDDSDFRVTFDDDVLARCEDLSLCSEVGGMSLLPEGKVLMEIKCAGGIPLYMTKVLSEERIYKTSFSKYGTAYEKLIYPKNKDRIIKNIKEVIHA